MKTGKSGLMVLAGLTVAGLLLASPPAWWAQRGVTTGAPANDYAAANIGQLKHIAKQAYLEMEARLPGGAGPAVTALVASWAQPPAEGVVRNDFAAVTQGQLKAVAKVFYDRLAEEGCTGHPLTSGQVYPWTLDTADDISFAPANIGQVKQLFSFDLYDNDADGLPDSWERQSLGTLTYAPSDDPGNVGWTLLQSYQQGLSPWPAPMVASGLRAWYRADAGITRDVDGKVSQWLDVSGQGFHVRQTAEPGRQPLFVANALNDQPVVQFDTGLQVLVTAGPAEVMAGEGDTTVIAVVKPHADPRYAGTIMGWGSDGNLNLGLAAPNITANQFNLIWRDGDGNTRQSPAINASADQVQILAAVKDGTAAAGYVNGVLQGSSEVPATLALLPSRLAVGNSTYPYYSFHGQIAEILVYNRALTPQERADITAALMAKYINPDSDADGLPDTWEDQHLGTRNHGPTDDPGNAGRTLLQSFAQGLSPWPSPIVAGGLQAWYRADHGITRDVDNKVSQWVDVSGHGFHVQQNTDTGRQPLFVASSLNNQPVVRFDTGLQVLLTPGLADVTAGGTDVTVIAVVKPHAEPRYAGTIFGWGTDGNLNLGLAAPNITANQFNLIWRDGDGNTRQSPALNASASQVQILAAVKDGMAAASYVNGVLQGSGEAPVTLALLPSRLSVGNATYPYYSFHGEIAEILIYNRALTAAERAAVEAALTAKYVDPDSDADGLPDGWEDLHLGTRNHGPTDDPGDVGRTLLQSYTQDLSPWPAPVVASGLRAWYRADRGVTKDGEDKVGEWVDVSGHGFHVQQTADPGRQPRFVASALNALPVVQFDTGLQVLLTAGPADVMAGEGDTTVIAVVKPHTEPRYAGTILGWGSDGNLNLGLSAPNITANQFNLMWRDGDGNTRQSPAINASADQVQILTAVKNGAAAGSYLNGVLQASGTVPATLALLPSRLSVGNATYPYYSFHGQIAEILVYNRALTPEERADVEAALMAKYIDMDADADGLPDAWEDQHFGTRTYGPTDDPGNTGRTLLDSYQQSLSPWPSPVVADGLRTWFRADLGVTKDGDNKVTQWADVSGHGFHVAQTADAGRRPLLVSGAMNNRPVVEFEGSTEVLLTPGLADVIAAGSDTTVIAVIKPHAEPHYAGTIVGWGTDGNLNFGLAAPNITANQFNLIWRDGDGNTRQSPGLTASAGEVQILAAVKNGPAAEGYVNGVLQGSAEVPATLALLPSRFSVGNATYPYYSFHGQVAEILVYNRALSATERQQVEAALTARYVGGGSIGYDFEATEGYVAGPLTGQQGWTSYAEDTVVEAVADAPSGSNVLHLAPNSFVSHPIDPPVTEGIAFIEFRARLNLGDNPSAALRFYLGGSLLVVAGDGSGGVIDVRAGSAGESPSLDPTTARFSVGSAEDSDWHRYTMRLNFGTRRWDLYLDGHPIAADLFLPPYAFDQFYVQHDGGGTSKGWLDLVEVKGSQPLFTDADGDGMDDAWEIAHGLNPTVDDRDGDLDEDGLSNIREYGRGTNPQNTDSDGDGLPDSWEVDHGMNPTLAADGGADTDGDGLTNAQEYLVGTDMQQAVTNSSGIPDGELDPDGDGLNHLQEFQQGTNPLDYYNGQAPIITALADYSEKLGPNGLFAVKVTDAEGNILVNAPVQFTTSAESLLTRNPYGLGVDLSVIARSGSDGIARVYVRPAN